MAKRTTKTTANVDSMYLLKAAVCSVGKETKAKIRKFFEVSRGDEKNKMKYAQLMYAGSCNFAGWTTEFGMVTCTSKGIKADVEDRIYNENYKERGLTPLTINHKASMEFTWKQVVAAIDEYLADGTYETFVGKAEGLGAVNETGKYWEEETGKRLEKENKNMPIEVKVVETKEAVKETKTRKARATKATTKKGETAVKKSTTVVEAAKEAIPTPKKRGRKPKAAYTPEKVTVEVTTSKAKKATVKKAKPEAAAPKQEAKAEAKAEEPSLLNKLIHAYFKMDGSKVRASVEGNMFYFTGNTTEYKDMLKELGMKWNRAKKAWEVCFAA